MKSTARWSLDRSELLTVCRWCSVHFAVRPRRSTHRAYDLAVKMIPHAIPIYIYIWKWIPLKCASVNTSLPIWVTLHVYCRRISAKKSNFSLILTFSTEDFWPNVVMNRMRILSKRSALIDFRFSRIMFLGREIKNSFVRNSRDLPDRRLACSLGLTNQNIVRRERQTREAPVRVPLITENSLCLSIWNWTGRSWTAPIKCMTVGRQSRIIARINTNRSRSDLLWHLITRMWH